MTQSTGTSIMHHRTPLNLVRLLIRRDTLLMHCLLQTYKCMQHRCHQNTVVHCIIIVQYVHKCMILCRSCNCKRSWCNNANAHNVYNNNITLCGICTFVYILYTQWTIKWQHKWMYDIVLMDATKDQFSLSLSLSLSLSIYIYIYIQDFLAE